MTKENAIKLYKHYCEMAVNPTGEDSVKRELVRKNALKAKADMEKHFANSKKYKKDDEEIKALLGEKK